MISIHHYKTEISSLCKNFRVSRLDVFGSAVTERFAAESDVDLLVSFEDDLTIGYAQNYIKFKTELEKLFDRKVDLLEAIALKNPFLIQRINAEKINLYAGIDQNLAI